jgi:hypothetical protein
LRFWDVLEDRKGNIWFGATIIEDKRGDTSFVSQADQAVSDNIEFLMKIVAKK